MIKLSSKVNKIKRLLKHYLNINSYKRYKYMTLEQMKSKLEKMYYDNTGSNMDISKPKKFSEKIQLYKIYSVELQLKNYTDKIKVREWIEFNIGESYLIPIYGIWNSFDEIDFDKLPDNFVLKTNHGAGMNVIVTNKNEINKNKLNAKFKKWLKINYAFHYGLELQYRDINPQIYAEKYIVDANGELRDYKFICFNGKVFYCWVDIARHGEHKRNIYDLDWNLQPWNIGDFPNSFEKIEKPTNFEKMVEVSSKLCRTFSHVRVDLYNVDGKIYFGELTFTTGSGFSEIKPSKYDLLLGEIWNI